MADQSPPGSAFPDLVPLEDYVDAMHQAVIWREIAQAALGRLHGLTVALHARDLLLYGPDLPLHPENEPDGFQDGL